MNITLQLFSTLAFGLLTPAVLADDYTGWQKKNPGWKLVFSDDFDGDTLDPAKWSRIDYVSWSSVSDWRRYQSRDEELVTMNGDGTVSLWGKYGDYTSQSDQTGAHDTYACGGIFTDKTFTFQYGYVEVRARFDCVAGAWPAIWMLPTKGPWPQTGEIDIMEHLNYQGIVHQTLHYNDASGNHTSTGTTNASGASTAYFDSLADKAAFHTYGVEWTPEAVVFYMDGTPTLSARADTNNPNWPFNMEDNPYYLLLDMQLGGNWVGDIGNIGDGVAMTVDYVHVYTSMPDATPGSLIQSRIPEPGTTTLDLLALGTLAARRRRS